MVHTKYLWLWYNIMDTLKSACKTWLHNTTKTALHMYTFTPSPCHVSWQAGGQVGLLGGEIVADEMSHEHSM